MNTASNTDQPIIALDRRDLRAILVLAGLGAFMSLLFALAGALVSIAYMVLFGAAALGLAVVAVNCLRGLKSA